MRLKLTLIGILLNRFRVNTEQANTYHSSTLGLSFVPWDGILIEEEADTQVMLKLELPTLWERLQDLAECFRSKPLALLSRLEFSRIDFNQAVWQKYRVKDLLAPLDSDQVSAATAALTEPEFSEPPIAENDRLVNLNEAEAVLQLDQCGRSDTTCTFAPVMRSPRIAVGNLEEGTTWAPTPCFASDEGKRAKTVCSKYSPTAFCCASATKASNCPKVPQLLQSRKVVDNWVSANPEATFSWQKGFKEEPKRVEAISFPYCHQLLRVQDKRSKKSKVFIESPVVTDQGRTWSSTHYMADGTPDTEIAFIRNALLAQVVPTVLEQLAIPSGPSISKSKFSAYLKKLRTTKPGDANGSGTLEKLKKMISSEGITAGQKRGKPAKATLGAVVDPGKKVTTKLDIAKSLLDFDGLKAESKTKLLKAFLGDLEGVNKILTKKALTSKKPGRLLGSLKFGKRGRREADELHRGKRDMALNYALLVQQQEPDHWQRDFVARMRKWTHDPDCPLRLNDIKRVAYARLGLGDIDLDSSSLAGILSYREQFLSAADSSAAELYIENCSEVVPKQTTLPEGAKTTKLSRHITRAPLNRNRRSASPEIGTVSPEIRNLTTQQAKTVAHTTKGSVNTATAAFNGTATEPTKLVRAPGVDITNLIENENNQDQRFETKSLARSNKFVDLQNRLGAVGNALTNAPALIMGNHSLGENQAFGPNRIVPMFELNFGTTSSCSGETTSKLITEQYLSELESLLEAATRYTHISGSRVPDPISTVFLSELCAQLTTSEVCGGPKVRTLFSSALEGAAADETGLSLLFNLRLQVPATEEHQLWKVHSIPVYKSEEPERSKLDLGNTSEYGPEEYAVQMVDNLPATVLMSPDKIITSTKSCADVHTCLLSDIQYHEPVEGGQCVEAVFKGNYREQKLYCTTLEEKTTDKCLVNPTRTGVLISHAGAKTSIKFTSPETKVVKCSDSSCFLQLEEYSEFSCGKKELKFGPTDQGTLTMLPDDVTMEELRKPDTWYNLLVQAQSFEEEPSEWIVVAVLGFLVLIRGAQGLRRCGVLRWRRRACWTCDERNPAEEKAGKRLKRPDLSSEVQLIQLLKENLLDAPIRKVPVNPLSRERAH